MVIVDSTVWVDYFNGAETPETDWLDRELSEQRLAVLDLIVCEVLQGVSSDEEADEVLAELRRLEIFDTGGVALASAAARNYRVLRSRGRTVRKTIDCLIATFCIDSGHALLHCDRDFDPFEEHLGLTVVHPQSRQTQSLSAATARHRATQPVEAVSVSSNAAAHPRGHKRTTSQSDSERTATVSVHRLRPRSKSPATSGSIRRRSPAVAESVEPVRSAVFTSV